MTDDVKHYFGYYSAKCAEDRGTITYRLLDGTETEVTVITQDPDNHNIKWDDLVCVGQLEKFGPLGPSPVRTSQKWIDYCASSRQDYKHI